jgi:hypothetical protein
MEQAAFQAPSKVCPHCGAMSQTTEKKCPNCGKGFKKRTLLKVFSALFLLGLITIVGCAALVGGAANEVSKQLDAEQAAHAISTRQFRSVDLGTRERTVIDQLGKQPEDKQQFQSESFVGNEPSNSSCIYYNKKGGNFGDVFQFCFTERKLDSKNAY